MRLDGVDGEYKVFRNMEGGGVLITPDYQVAETCQRLWGSVPQAFTYAPGGKTYFDVNVPAAFLRRAE